MFEVNLRCVSKLIAFLLQYQTHSFFFFFWKTKNQLSNDKSTFNTHFIGGFLILMYTKFTSTHPKDVNIKTQLLVFYH